MTEIALNHHSFNRSKKRARTSISLVSSKKAKNSDCPKDILETSFLTEIYDTSLIDDLLILFNQTFQSSRNYEIEVLYLKYYIEQQIQSISEEHFFQQLENGSQYETFLGFCYHYGVGKKQDYNIALKLYHSHAKLGDAIAQFLIGLLYQGVFNDIDSAFRWYLNSAESGNKHAQYYLGFCYKHGKGTIKDEKKADEWFSKSAYSSSKRPQRKNVGFIAGNKYDINKRAFEHYLRLAKAGNDQAQCSIGLFYQNGIGTIKDDKKAFQWYLKSALSGNSKAQCSLGDCFKDGLGAIKDEKAAFECYLKSAEPRNVNGRNNFSTLYDKKVEMNRVEQHEFNCFKKSARPGNSSAMSNLGECYQRGKYTIKDERKAFECYVLSAEYGDKNGQFNLGFCYQYGIGVLSDQCLALKWYEIAKESGHLKAQEMIEDFNFC